ncbi:MAG: hypothetical protein M1834_006803 [Cirrosporium novae-zelandiae]|nr:MAG: hypothetical protein M1834_006803 [Cirrosporium novae-zelandiae]
MTIEPSTSNDPPKPKRSLFKKPAWSVNDPTDDSGDIFRRNTFIDFEADKERKRQKKAARKQAEKEKERAAKEAQEKAKEDADRAARESKRRRSSDEDDLYGSAASIRSGMIEETQEEDWVRDMSLTAKSRNVSEQPELGYSPPTKSLRVTRAAAVSNASQAIDLDTDSDTQSRKITVRYPPPKPSNNDDFDDCEDEEFPELAARARERAKAKRLAAQKSSSPESSMGTPAGIPLPTRQSEPPEHDEIVAILITSRLPNTSPLIIRRKESQRLHQVRLAWCAKQGFNEETTESIFLTWKGNRLFDSSTCKNLGANVYNHNDTLQSFRDVGEDMDEDEPKIHVEAMTEELLTLYNKEKEEAHLKALREEAGEDDFALEPEPPKEKYTHIFLRNPDYEEVRLKVRLHTTISHIVNAYRQERNIDGGKQVFLDFDGEKLDPRMTIEQAEVSDMDIIDVHVK